MLSTLQQPHQLLGQLQMAKSTRSQFFVKNRFHVKCSGSIQEQSPGDNCIKRRTLLQAGAALSAFTVLPRPLTASANVPISKDWEQVKLPVDNGVVLLDIGFTGDDKQHGFLLGTRQTLLETKDGGKSWEPKPIAAAQDEGFNYRFNAISFNGSEGWIVGKPPILLHTTDGGENWERIPLSNKLPGTPLVIKALAGEGEAEMTTDQGGIYKTTNAALTWSAQVQETVDATLNRTVSSGISGASYYEGSFSNIARSTTGEYVAVSSRGNFFMTWSPGQTFWFPHNRPVGRRIQNMGWTPNNRLWITTRGGDIFVSPQDGVSESFEQSKLGSRGFGILDVGFKDDSIAYACGGSGSLFKSDDSGKSWKRERETDGIAGNLYEIKFNTVNQGFILGNNGILLRYIGA
eukprot:TRINITY_DN3613_c0_g2_i1.p1 TRINITY_DN3613_c0_g2~~TRINITY_DN3613_c0_g2_i1.p1  ORF type:complete len:404 (-),score=40.26 TRINITY_DN3613_c0_g2_i1:347-1558(-)